ncbi:hypothetical protein EBT25_19255 [bacterium]|nr:hypothetical protein [bacterium]
MTKTTKLSQAIEAYKTGNYKTNAEFVQYLIDSLGMSKLGARTYAYNVKKQLGRWAVESDVIGAAPKTKTKSKKVRKVEPELTPDAITETPETDPNDPFAIPDFLDRRKKKVTSRLKAASDADDVPAPRKSRKRTVAEIVTTEMADVSQTQTV